MNMPTQEQKHRMIFSATFRQPMDVEDATDQLNWLLSDVTNPEDLADALRFHGFITNVEAVKLAKGQGFVFDGLRDDIWERYTRKTGRFVGGEK